MKKVLVLLMMLFAIAVPVKAKAHPVLECSTEQEPGDQMDCGRENIRRGTTSIRFLKNNRRAGNRRSRSSLRRSARYLIRYGNRHVSTATHRLIPHMSGWLCIHRYEGAWNDAGDPYWGGLQMDKSFMRAYAPAYLLRRGWANTWTPLEQMMVAERAHRTRGYYPWPNTARYCGLL